MAAAGEPQSTTPAAIDPNRVEALLKVINADQKNILTALNLVLDGFESQTKYIQEMANMDKEDPST